MMRRELGASRAGAQAAALGSDVVLCKAETRVRVPLGPP